MRDDPLGDNPYRAHWIQACPRYDNPEWNWSKGQHLERFNIPFFKHLIQERFNIPFFKNPHTTLVISL